MATTEFFPLIYSRHFYWNTVSKQGSIKARDFIGVIGAKVPRIFYIRSDNTEQKILWEHMLTDGNRWIYKSMSLLEDLEDWTVVVLWEK